MSFEGYNEYLCVNGHYTTQDIYMSLDEDLVCDTCGCKMAYQSLVDVTNGHDPDLPETIPAEKLKFGDSDLWKKDHYGNKYAIAIPRYDPHSSRWRKI